MALIVEDGTGKADADAFVSVADCDAYHVALGNSDWTGDETVKEAAIRRSTAYLTTAYVYVGERLKGRSQSLSWPRNNAYDVEGDLVPNNEVPTEIVAATCEAALYELTNPNGLNQVITLTERTKSEKVDVIEVEYAGTSGGVDAAKPVLTKLENLIAALIISKASGGGTGFVARA